MTGSKTPEWVVEQATDLSDEVFDACIDSYEGHDGADYTAIISQALLSAYERGRAEREWQQIETAPKERTYDTWLLSDGVTVTTGHWTVIGDWGGLNWNRVLPGWQPTHWMPLPAPLAKENANER